VTADATVGVAVRRWPIAEVSALLAVASAAWLGTIVVARGMGVMPGTMGLGLAGFVGVWALMMAAMMLPSVTPFATLYARGVHDHRFVRLGCLMAGYLFVWAAAGVPAFGLARLAGGIADAHPSLATTAAVAIFAACGIYQLTPVKDRCLVRCRSPLGDLLHYSGYRGRTRELRIGIRHGAYCFACCWALMALLVAFGMMNVAAMVVLAGVVLVEKRTARGQGFARLVGVAALALAAAVIWAPGLAPGLHASHPMGGM
jgi:predicted metal-binding membrane protein